MVRCGQPVEIASVLPGLAGEHAVVADAVSISVTNGCGQGLRVVVLAPQTERLLTGKTLTSALVEQARQMMAKEVTPISDLRSTEHYRRIVTGNVLVKFLRKLLG